MEHISDTGIADAEVMPPKDILECMPITPEATVLDSSAEFVALPLYDGEIGILPLHSNMIGRLGYGEMRLKEGSRLDRFYIDGGFVQVINNRVYVLTNPPCRRKKSVPRQPPNSWKRLVRGRRRRPNKWPVVSSPRTRHELNCALPSVPRVVLRRMAAHRRTVPTNPAHQRRAHDPAAGLFGSIGNLDCRFGSCRVSQFLAAAWNLVVWAVIAAFSRPLISSPTRTPAPLAAPHSGQMRLPEHRNSVILSGPQNRNQPATLAWPKGVMLCCLREDAGSDRRSSQCSPSQCRLNLCRILLFPHAPPPPSRRTRLMDRTITRFDLPGKPLTATVHPDGA